MTSARYDSCLWIGSQIHHIEEIEEGTDRAARALRNQRRLWTWESCTARLIEAVNPILFAKSGSRIS
jgi:hypothetical protein